MENAREEKNRRQRERRANRTPEEREAHRQRRRERRAHSRERRVRLVRPIVPPVVQPVVVYAPPVYINTRKERYLNRPELPTHIREEMIAMADALQKKWECPICMEEKSPRDFFQSVCGHRECRDCHTGNAEVSWDAICPVCRA